MQVSSGIRYMYISHLEDCLEKLILKDDGNNTLEVKYLYSLIYQIICELKELDDGEVIGYYRRVIDGKVRNLLHSFNIILVP